MNQLPLSTLSNTNLDTLSLHLSLTLFYLPVILTFDWLSRWGTLCEMHEDISLVCVELYSILLIIISVILSSVYGKVKWDLVSVAAAFGRIQAPSNEAFYCNYLWNPTLKRNCYHKSYCHTAWFLTVLGSTTPKNVLFGFLRWNSFIMYHSKPMASSCCCDFQTGVCGSFLLSSQQWDSTLELKWPLHLLVPDIPMQPLRKTQPLPVPCPRLSVPLLSSILYRAPAVSAPCSEPPPCVPPHPKS